MKARTTKEASAIIPKTAARMLPLLKGLVLMYLKIGCIFC